MAPLKRNWSATLAKLPPELPIRPITKCSRQKPPELSTTFVTLPLPLRPTKPTTTSTPTAFNSSQVDELESEEDMQARVANKLESKEESKEEENNNTYYNKYLD